MSGELWKVLDESTKGMSAQEINAISNNSSVKSAKSEMMEAFVDFFLFPKYREEFAALPAFRPICDRYINSIANAKAKRIEELDNLEQENARLKEELARLQKWTPDK